MSSSATTPSSNLRSVSLRVTIVLLLLVGAGAFFAIRWRRNGAVTIGVEGQRTIEVAGPKLIAAPFTPGDALSVRIASEEKTKDGYRYDIRYMAFGPGQHDIGKSLADPDGKRPAPQTAFDVSVAALIPEKYSGELFNTKPSSIDLHTNYSLLMTLAWGSWALLLVPLIYYSRDWSKRQITAPPRPNITQRLRQLLQQAARTELTPQQQTDLEQLLLAFWSQRLNLSEQRLSETIEQLRQHPQAGPQWSSVERWFHARSTSASNVAAKQLLTDLEALN
ncbi:hypothetical protein [Anatilimnocola floriformis]|uniref:hypothetical protein n=1 Tax=Anatilimnocola floriformis TaxID=2948575 RepID=UPI0020C25CFC|nr:hypothetical protein [Anatilimnocola floriformis]